MSRRPYLCNVNKLLHQVVLSAGCNQGNCIKTFELALQFLADEEINIIRKSSLYRTQAWGNTLQNDFLNQVWVIETNLSPEALLIKLKQTERRYGRTDFSLWQPRPLDLDILFFDDCHIRSDELEIPHPYIALRKFVLIPLAEILPELVHPLTGKSIKQLLSECNDNSTVMKIIPDAHESI